MKKESLAMRDRGQLIQTLQEITNYSTMVYNLIIRLEKDKKDILDNPTRKNALTKLIKESDMELTIKNIQDKLSNLNDLKKAIEIFLKGE